VFQRIRDRESRALRFRMLTVSTGDPNRWHSHPLIGYSGSGTVFRNEKGTNVFRRLKHFVFFFMLCDWLLLFENFGATAKLLVSLILRILNWFLIVSFFLHFFLFFFDGVKNAYKQLPKNKF